VAHGDERRARSFDRLFAAPFDDVDQEPAGVERGQSPRCEISGMPKMTARPAPAGAAATTGTELSPLRPKTTAEPLSFQTATDPGDPGAVIDLTPSVSSAMSICAESVETAMQATSAAAKGFIERFYNPVDRLSSGVGVII
jgi:hypothetical protein